jgi:N-acylneuraminate cytidylyltransferase
VSLLKQAYNLIKQSDFDSVRPVIRFDYPVQRAFKLNDGKVEFMNPEHARTRSQDLEPAFHDAGMFYFIKNGYDLTGNNKGAFEIKPIYAQDIDTEDDWRIAEFKYKFLYMGS